MRISCAFLATGGLALVTAASSQAPQAELVAALEADDECRGLGGGVCALDLKQLRAATSRQPGALAEPAGLGVVVDSALQAPAVLVAGDPAPLSSASDAIEPPASEIQAAEDYGHPEWLDSCNSLFVDVGSGVGVNARKLFEPGKYPESPLLPFLTEHIGSPGWRRGTADKSGVCVLGLEPNPAYQERLQQLQRAYEGKNWHVHFYPFAAWHSEGSLPFTTTGKRALGPDAQAGEGAHLVASGEGGDGTVRTVDFARFLQSLPHPVDLMVMDVEGAEYEIFAQLFQEDALCDSSVRRALVAAHNWGDITHWGGGASFEQGIHPRSFHAIQQHLAELEAFGWCRQDKVTEVTELEDSTYSTDVDDEFDSPPEESDA